MPCWVQGDKNRPSLGRKQLTSTSQILFYFPKILVPNLTTKTNYQAPVKNYRQSSQAIAADTSPALWYDADQWEARVW